MYCCRYGIPFRKFRRGKVLMLMVVFSGTFSMFLAIYSVTAPKSVLFVNTWLLPSTASKPTTNSAKATQTEEFRLLLPFVEPVLSQERLYIAIVVNSDAESEKHRELRNAIRNTWGEWTARTINSTWKVFFALGVSDNATIQQANRREAFKKNDVIIGNFSEHYKNIPLKTFMGHYWVTSRLPSCKYVLKTDDDVYVRVPTFIKWLDRNGSPERLYGGYVSGHLRPHRDPASKWFITEEQFNETKWPPFCHGAFHVLSTDILPDYFHYALHRRKPFHTDDAYLGVVARDLNISAIRIPGFNLEFWYKTRSDCELMTSIAMGHMLNTQNMNEYYTYYKKREAVYFNLTSCS